jgi:hypothetical protein
MVEFYYNCFVNEATSCSPFEAMYGFQPSTPANRLLHWLVLLPRQLTDWLWLGISKMLFTNWLNCRRNEWQLVRLGLLLYSNRTIMSIYRQKVSTSDRKSVNTFATNDWVHSRLFVRLILTPTNYCYLKDAVHILCFIATCNPMPHRWHDWDLIRQKLKTTMKSMHLIIL